MNLDKVQFYNLGAIEEIPGFGENALVRVPAKIRNQLNERARFVGMDSVGMEIQFVTDAPNIDLYITVQQTVKSKGIIKVFKGNFLYQTLEAKPGNVEFFRLNPPPNFIDANETLLCQEGYSPNVWRIVFDRSIAVCHGINTHGHEIRPPKEDEIPSLNWLAYGSSITNSNLEGYPHIVAALLRAQVQNKGFSGSCHIEKEIVDYIIDECSFDFITCELGVNMRGCYTPEEFENRANYLIDRLVKLEKPAIIITTFPNRLTPQYTNNLNMRMTENEREFNNILVKLVEKACCKTVQLVHGHEILTDTNGLSADLLHPTNYGHAIMGTNLAKKITLFLNECGIKELNNKS